MNHKLRIAGYIVVLATLVGVLLAGPVAWATPGQGPHNQTVPTRTPKPPPEPTSDDGDEQPTDTPAQPIDTPAPPAATSAPDVTPLPPVVTGAAPAQSARLRLEKRADRSQAWPGASIDYTLVLSNVGGAAARQVIIEDPLPPGLLPGEILQGAGAGWNQRTLRARIPVLAPGGKYTVTFRALVDPDAAGPTLLNRASASAAGGLTTRADLSLALPPNELPPVGGNPEQTKSGEATRR